MSTFFRIVEDIFLFFRSASFRCWLLSFGWRHDNFERWRYQTGSKFSLCFEMKGVGGAAVLDNSIVSGF